MTPEVGSRALASGHTSLLRTAAWAVRGARQPRRRSDWCGTLVETADQVVRTYPDVQPLRQLAQALREHALAAATARARDWRIEAVHRIALELAERLCEESDENEEFMARAKKTTKAKKTTIKKTSKGKLPPPRETKQRREAAEAPTASQRQVRIRGVDPETTGEAGALTRGLATLAAFYAVDQACEQKAAWGDIAGGPARSLLAALRRDDGAAILGERAWDRLGVPGTTPAPPWWRGWETHRDELRRTLAAVVEADALPPPALHIARDPEHPLYQSRAELPADRELVASIAEHGVDVPLLCVRREGAVYVVAGRRRLAATHAYNRQATLAWYYEGARLALVERVPVDLRELDDVGARRLMARENAQRLQLSELQEAEEALQLARQGCTQRQIAVELKISTGKANNLLQLQRLVPALLGELRNGRLMLQGAYELARLTEPEQLAIWRRVRELTGPAQLAALRAALGQPAASAPMRARAITMLRDRLRAEPVREASAALVLDVLDALAGATEALERLPTQLRMLIETKGGGGST